MQITVPFIPAKELKQKFDVLGHFYSIEVPGTEPVKCRNVLEIRSKDACKDDPTDAVFVMMNPGSSRPMSETNYVVTSADISSLKDQLVPTVPDVTQYQVMRVMHYVGWVHVRVINLSDLRDPKSDSFVERYTSLERSVGVESHSVFSSDRAEQLQHYLSRKPNAPIVCAWGVGNALNPLIARARKALASEPGVTGLAKLGQHGKYFHPLPTLQHQKERWVAKMLAQLQPNNSMWTLPATPRDQT